MPYRNVLLISKNPALVKWCCDSISGFFDKKSEKESTTSCIEQTSNFIVHDSISQARDLFAKGTPITIIIADRPCCHVRPLLALYIEACEFKGIPFIIFDTHKHHPKNYQPSFLFRRAYYLEPFRGNPFPKIHARKAVPLKDPFSQEDPFIHENIPKHHNYSVLNFYQQIHKAAACDVPCLLLGESGSGKTYWANFIHSKSSRNTMEPVYHNIAELTPSLAESQLFGTESNAYTGSQKSAGVLESANGSTLILDEIGELPLELQPKLLSVIERKKFRRLGSQTERDFDARLIFATNRNLEDCIKAGTFRKDLYYRINVLKITIPPLRDHPQDIPDLARQIASQQGKTLDQSALKVLTEYSWPGNIRELQNVMLRSCIMSQADILSSTDILFE